MSHLHFRDVYQNICTIVCETFVRIVFIQQQNSSSADEAAQLEEVVMCFLTFADECVLPSLALLPSNCCMSEEVWNFLKLFKYEYR